MPNADIKALYQRWLNDLWKADTTTIKQSIHEIVTADFVGNWPERQIHGADELAEWISTGGSFFTDLEATITQGPVVDGDLLAARWLMSGTYAGGLDQCTAPVGTTIAVHHTDFLRFKDGRFTECWAGSDQVDGLKQIGATTFTACQWFENGAAIGV